MAHGMYARGLHVIDCEGTRLPRSYLYIEHILRIKFSGKSHSYIK